MIAVVAGGIFINGALSRPAQVLGAQTDITAQHLLDDTNKDRAAAQEQSVSMDERLNQAAQAKADDMVAKNYWAHVTPTGQQPWSFITATGYQYQAAGENLAYGFDSADTLLGAWMHSPEHRANVLGQSYTDVGFGIAESNDFMGNGPETVVVALYARPVGAVAAAATGTTSAPANAETVSRVQTLAAAPTASDLVIGLVGSLAILFVLVRHGIAWRKLINRGELFALQHPVLDISLVALAMLAVILNHTIGFIN